MGPRSDDQVYGKTATRERNDLRPGMLMATSGRHCIFFETDESRILVVRILGSAEVSGKGT